MHMVRVYLCTIQHTAFHCCCCCDRSRLLKFRIHYEHETKETRDKTNKLKLKPFDPAKEITKQFCWKDIRKMITAVRCRKRALSTDKNNITLFISILKIATPIIRLSSLSISTSHFPFHAHTHAAVRQRHRQPQSIHFHFLNEWNLHSHAQWMMKISWRTWAENAIERREKKMNIFLLLGLLLYLLQQLQSID